MGNCIAFQLVCAQHDTNTCQFSNAKSGFMTGASFVAPHALSAFSRRAQTNDTAAPVRLENRVAERTRTSGVRLRVIFVIANCLGEFLVLAEHKLQIGSSGHRARTAGKGPQGERLPTEILLRQRRVKAGRGDWRSFEPYPLIVPIVTVFDGPTLPFVATAERLVRLCA